MGKATPSEVYAFSKALNPYVCQVFYDTGLAASNEFMTIEEAAAVTSSDMSTIVGWRKALDTVFAEPFDGYQYFTGLNLINLENVRGTSVTLPDIPVDIYMRYFGYATGISGLVVRVPASITGIRYFGLGDLGNGTTIIFEGATPPSFRNDGRMESCMNNEYNIYVPDNAVAAYQSHTTRYTIHPISDYAG